MDMKCMESESPPVSIEDRTIVGTTDRGLNSTNHMPEVGGSRNCVPLYNDTLNPYLLRWAWELVGVGWMSPSGSLGVRREGPNTWVLAGAIQMSW